MSSSFSTRINKVYWLIDWVHFELKCFSLQCLSEQPGPQRRGKPDKEIKVLLSIDNNNICPLTPRLFWTINKNILLRPFSGSPLWEPDETNEQQVRIYYWSDGINQSEGFGATVWMTNVINSMVEEQPLQRLTFGAAGLSWDSKISVMTD